MESALLGKLWNLAQLKKYCCLYKPVCADNFAQNGGLCVDGLTEAAIAPGYCLEEEAPVQKKNLFLNVYKVRHSNPLPQALWGN